MLSILVHQLAIYTHNVHLQHITNALATSLNRYIASDSVADTALNNNRIKSNQATSLKEVQFLATEVMGKAF